MELGTEKLILSILEVHLPNLEQSYYRPPVLNSQISEEKPSVGEANVAPSIVKLKSKKLKHITDTEILKEIEKIKLNNTDKAIRSKLIKELVNKYDVSSSKVLPQSVPDLESKEVIKDASK
jgi:hypothetical protein